MPGNNIAFDLEEEEDILLLSPESFKVPLALTDDQVGITIKPQKFLRAVPYQSPGGIRPVCDHPADPVQADLFGIFHYNIIQDRLTPNRCRYFDLILILNLFYQKPIENNLPRVIT